MSSGVSVTGEDGAVSLMVAMRTILAIIGFPFPLRVIPSPPGITPEGSCCGHCIIPHGRFQSICRPPAERRYVRSLRTKKGVRAVERPARRTLEHQPTIFTTTLRQPRRITVAVGGLGAVQPFAGNRREVRQIHFTVGIDIARHTDPTVRRFHPPVPNAGTDRHY